MSNRVFNLSLPDELVKKADEQAKKNFQSRTDVIKEALMQYLGFGTQSEGRKLHGQAAEARERGESVTALSLYHQALAAYSAENDALGFAEALADESISLRHLYEGTDDSKWLVLAKHDTMAAVEIAQSSGNRETLALPLFNLAKTQDELGEYDEAVKSYKLAIENLEKNLPKIHKLEERTAILADFKMHLATAEFKAGDKSALHKAEQALNELEEGTEISDYASERGASSAYNKKVWLSGAHMNMADMLRGSDPVRAMKHLNEAKKIINSDERLVLRQKQWNKFAETFKVK